MAIDASKLAEYISEEMRNEFQLDEISEGLTRYSNAMARAISRYLEDDVEVDIGQQIFGQGVGEIDDGGGGTTTVNTEVTGKVTTKGNLT